MKYVVLRERQNLTHGRSLSTPDWSSRSPDHDELLPYLATPNHPSLPYSVPTTTYGWIIHTLLGHFLRTARGGGRLLLRSSSSSSSSSTVTAPRFLLLPCSSSCSCPFPFPFPFPFPCSRAAKARHQHLHQDDHIQTQEKPMRDAFIHGGVRHRRRIHSCQVATHIDEGGRGRQHARPRVRPQIRDDLTTLRQ